MEDYSDLRHEISEVNKMMAQITGDIRVINANMEFAAASQKDTKNLLSRVSVRQEDYEKGRQDIVNVIRSEMRQGDDRLLERIEALETQPAKEALEAKRTYTKQFIFSLISVFVSCLVGFMLSGVVHP